ncbi:unnamed protein product [Alopecurus aequalis]
MSTIINFGEGTTEMNAPQHDPEDPDGAAAAAALARQADDAGLMKRIRIYLEAIVKMVSTVFLAACVSLAKMDMRDLPIVQGFLSAVAGGTLVVAILALVLITLPNRFPDKLYHWCMFFINLCGIFLMFVAYLTLRLISEDYQDGVCWAVLLVFSGLILLWYIYSRFKGHARGTFEDSVHQEKHLDKLENWVDFTAAVTFLLFLGLGAFLIGGQYNSGSMLLPVFQFIIYLSFSTCIAGVFFMLACIVMVDPVSDGISTFLHIVNYTFGGTLALIVLLITFGKMGPFWVSIASVLSVLPPAIWGVLAYRGIRRGDQEVTPAGPVCSFCKKCIACLCGPIGSRGDDEVKPASLDLTKVTCMGFVAISAYTISQNTPVSTGNSYSWFIFFTAVAVSNFIWWRLFTHHKKPSAACFKAANWAFLYAHIYAIVAVIPLAFMAYHAFNRKNSTDPSCHAPSHAPAPAPS